MTAYYDEKNDKSFIETLVEKNIKDLRVDKFIVFYKYPVLGDEANHNKAKEEFPKFFKLLSEEFQRISDGSFKEISMKT